ncbi:hypothetical protein BGX26_008799 [Mortierella sp. AD094]|nr:hypothetical protein BGX26_008799 [Mortierella sp. AD094]
MNTSKNLSANQKYVGANEAPVNANADEKVSLTQLIHGDATLKKKKPKVKRRRNTKAVSKDTTPHHHLGNNENLAFVRNLHWDLDENGLKEAFKLYHVLIVYIPRRINRRSKGFGFIKFNDDSERSRAINEMMGVEILERPLDIKIAKFDDPSSNPISS